MPATHLVRRRLGSRGLGVAMAGITAVISGFAVFINGYGVRAWSAVGSPTTYTTFKNVVAAGVLVAVATAMTRRSGRSAIVRPTGGVQWLGLLLVALIGGSAPFVLFFEGLSRATSTQAAFIHKTLVIWVAALAVSVLRERITSSHVVAIGLLVGGQLALSGGTSGMVFGIGEVMVLGATLLWAVEVILAKRMLPRLSPLTIGVARMGGGALALVVFGLLSGGLSSLGTVTASHVWWVVLTGTVLSLYVASWFTALSLAPAVDVTAVLVGGALITAALRGGIQGALAPAGLGLGLIGCGVAVAAIAATRRPDPGAST